MKKKKIKIALAQIKIEQKNIEENAHVIIHIEPYFDNKKDGTV